MSAEPFWACQRHEDEIDAAFIRQFVGAPQYALLDETLRQIYMARPIIVGQHVKPETVGRSFAENPIEHEAQELAAEAASRILHGDAFETDIAMNVINVANNGKGAGLPRSVGPE